MTITTEALNKKLISLVNSIDIKATSAQLEQVAQQWKAFDISGLGKKQGEILGGFEGLTEAVDDLATALVGQPDVNGVPCGGVNEATITRLTNTVQSAIPGFRTELTSHSGALAALMFSAHGASATAIALAAPLAKIAEECAAGLLDDIVTDGSPEAIAAHYKSKGGVDPQKVKSIIGEVAHPDVKNDVDKSVTALHKDKLPADVGISIKLGSDQLSKALGGLDGGSLLKAAVESFTNGIGSAIQSIATGFDLSSLPGIKDLQNLLIGGFNVDAANTLAKSIRVPDLLRKELEAQGEVVKPNSPQDIQRIIDKVDADKFNAKFSAEAQIENNALKFTLKQLDDKVVNSDTSTAMTIAPGPGKTASPIVDPGSGAYTSSFPFINSVEETVRYLQTANREITTVVWHWSGHYTDQGYVGSQEIDKSHKKKGLNEIGYHFIIKRDGSLQVGRNINKTGAHTAGFNDRSIGIAFVAGYKCTSDKYEGVPPTSEVGKASITQAQMKAFWFFMLAWYKAAPGGQAWGHNDFRARGHSDPGFDVHDAVFNMFHKHNVGHPWVDSKILTTREISIKTAHHDTLEKVVEPGTLDTPKKLTIFEKRDKFVAEQKVAALGIGV